MKDIYHTNIYTASEDRYQLLKDFSRQNRRNPTEAEACMWTQLRAEALGVKFRRQHPIGDYIADFVALSAKLIIEIDGGYHTTADQQAEDAVRSVNLENQGYKILRFTNQQVLADTDNVIKTIKETLRQ